MRHTASDAQTGKTARTLAECNGGQQQAGALTAGRWLWCPSLKGLLVFDTWRADERVQPAPVVLQTLVTPQRRLDLEQRGPGALTLDADERESTKLPAVRRL